MLKPDQARRMAASDLFDAEPAPSPDDADVTAPIPERIGPYRVVRRIASGGMGTVYEAMQDQPQRRVAIKVLRPGVANGETVRRFKLEVQLLGKLQHPGIAQIFDAGTYDDGGGGMPYFIMEYIAGGEAITSFAKASGLTRRRRLALVLQVCDAVHHGHLRGIVHRDLKPHNILVVPDSEAAPPASPPGSARDNPGGRVKVIDFGVARSLDDGAFEQTTLTRGGQVLGTLPYMSPEQCDGDADARTDVYALAAR